MSKPTGRNNVLTHFLQDHPRNFGDATTADHKDLNEESESRLQHRYAVVVQDCILIGFSAALRRIILRKKR